jgi:hypothetical protein
LAFALAAILAVVASSTLARGSGGHPPKAGQSSPHSGSHSGSHAEGRSYKSGAGHVAGAQGSHSSGKPAQHAASSHRGKQAVAGDRRDPDGKIHRSVKAKDDFRKSHACPSTGKSSGACPGYVIDHVKPLKRGGADSPSNMQWQTKAAAKAKDKVE